MGLLPEVFWSLTMREFALAVDAYMQAQEAERDRLEWQTAHIMHACAAIMGKAPSPKSILNEWKRAREGVPDWLRPPETVDERFLKKIAERGRTNGGNGNHSQI